MGIRERLLIATAGENGKKKNAAPKESAIGKMFAKKQKKAEEKQTG